VVGIAGYGQGDSLGGATWALFDLPTAQRVLGREGELDSVSVVGDPNVSAVDLQRRISDVLPKGAEAVTAATVTSEAQDQIATGLGFLRTAFLVFAFVALFVGAFIIFNTFSIILAQRTRELALFRALGASGRQVMTSVLVEAVVVGLVSSLLGIVLGIGIAILLKGLLNAIGVEIPSSGTVILARTIVVSIIVGTLVTVVAALVPARRAARVAPIEALREAQDRPGRSLRFRLISGIVVLALGVIPLVYGLFGTPSNALSLVGIGVALTFLGVAMLTPLFARPVAGAIGLPIRKTGVPGKLGGENSRRNPRRTAATASALMIGLGLVVFVAVFGASAKASTTAILDRTLKADFILTSPTFSGFSTAAAEDLRGVEGVQTVSSVRQAEVHIKDGTSFVSGIDPATLPAVSELGASGGSIDDLRGSNTIAVYDKTATDNGWSLGDTIPVEFPATGTVDMKVVALYAENGLIGDYAISLDTFDANVAQRLDIFVLVKAEPGSDLAAVRGDIETALKPYPNVEVQDQAQFRDKYATFLNQILNLVTALLLLAVFIALFGVMNTLYLSIYERTRELGLLRAVGLTRRQTRSMVRWEAVIISVMGALLGVVIGIAFGWALQQALEPEGFTELGIPGGQLVFYVVFAALLGVFFAIFPARRAAKLNVLEAISYE
jgi:putative ABC transport system permease protein